jgi:uncharacterized protein (TIGR00251 family)
VTTGASGASGVSRHPHGSLLSAVVVPRAGKSSIAQLADGSIQIRLVAPPVDGAANTSLLRFLADILDVPRSRIEIVSGASSRRKRIFIAGVASDDLETRLHAALEKST